MNLYRRLVRPLLFCLDAELAHHGAVEACRMGGLVPGVGRTARWCCEFAAAELESQVAGVRFPNPIGLAAGWDKNGRAAPLLAHLGFGSVEIGSISAQLSPGNPRPRLFRLPRDQAIVVNYGLPNDGAEIVARRIASQRLDRPLGINIVTTNRGAGGPCADVDDILADYEQSVVLLQRRADYLMLNLSCPNAADGRDLFSQPGGIQRLLQRLQSRELSCPVFLKVAPRDEPAEHERLLRETEPFSFVRGFSFNLPAGKPATLQLRSPREAWAALPGAVAGRPVRDLINRCVAGLFPLLDRRRHAIIAAGGVFTAEDAYEMIQHGASLVQLHTALVYEGPSIAGRINRGLHRLLARDGFRHVAEAIGAAGR